MLSTWTFLNISCLGISALKRFSFTDCDNIWFEPHAGKFGSFAKDKVELLLWRKVYVSKTMTLDQAKTAYLQGWTKLFPQH
jgi:hypothetical protein